MAAGEYTVASRGGWMKYKQRGYKESERKDDERKKERGAEPSCAQPGRCFSDRGP